MTPAHLLDRQAESRRFLTMQDLDSHVEFVDEGERAGEGIHADHLIPEFCFRQVAFERARWTPRDFAIAAGAIGAQVAHELSIIRKSCGSSDYARGIDWEAGRKAACLAVEAWHYAQCALELEEQHLATLNGVTR